MNSGRTFLRVAVATPVHRLFDYLPPSDGELPGPGQRVRIPFGRRRSTGVVAAIADETDVPADKLRRAECVLDAEPLLDAPLVELLNWASDYYQHPPGEVYAAALPAALRQGGSARPAPVREWRLTDEGRAVEAATLAKRAPVQCQLLSALAERGTLPDEQLSGLHSGARKAMGALRDKGWVELREFAAEAAEPSAPGTAGHRLSEAQQTAVEGVPADGFAPCLLEGVTGSGKTEVYLRLIEAQLARGRQALVLVPEIGLTPQLLERFESRLRARLAVLHSGLTDTQRLENWLLAHSGTADVIVGTRSAVFVPLPRPGLIVIDEEHDASFKQQDGFRYSARDLAVWRGRRLDVPVVLGSATPSFETLNNAIAGRYQHLRLPERAGSAQPPALRLIDLRHFPPTEGLSQPLRDTLRRHLEAGNQALVYLNRRGFAPTLLCPDCGETVECPRCDARLVLHQRRARLACHHCGTERPVPERCDDCAGELVPVGHGTERLEQALESAFPDHPLVRIDRDTTRRRGELAKRLERVRSGEARILLGTQMLTKGHDFPDVTCVGIVDSDQGLFGTDFRASERLAQTILQVAGRAGRAEKPGEVWIQTWYPEHPLLTTLLSSGYDAFAEAALRERGEAQWPPFAHLALLRSEAADRARLFDFLGDARDAAEALGPAGIRLLGPATAPMEKRSGRFRGQLLLQSEDRGRLQRFLPGWRAALDALKSARRTRWSLDVDPLELF